MLPDPAQPAPTTTPVPSQCTYRCVVLPDLTPTLRIRIATKSQCTYRCVVLPDEIERFRLLIEKVSMHLQVRGAP